jgi:hypothetical protein
MIPTKIKSINNIKNGYHLNSKYWQDKKLLVPNLSDLLFSILVGCLLGDATIYKISSNASVKFEQGYMHKEYLFHLFLIFNDYVFQTKPHERIELRGKRVGSIKSYSFKTFSHPTFNKFYDLFIINSKKSIQPGLIFNYLTPIGLAY